MKLLAIGGEPATGKSTLANMLFEKMSSVDFQYGTCKGHIDERHNLAMVGIYGSGETFVGTDKLSMSVQPDFLNYCKTKNRNIIFEGDRLFNRKLLWQLQEVREVRIIVLEQTAEELQRRHEARRDRQSEVFLRGRKTKIENICYAFGNKIEKHQLDNTNQSRELANELWEWVT